MFPPHFMCPLVLSSHRQTSSFAIYKALHHHLISMSPLYRQKGQAVAVRINMVCPGGCQEGPTAMGKQLWVLTGDFQCSLGLLGRPGRCREEDGRSARESTRNPPLHSRGTAKREGQDGWPGAEGRQPGGRTLKMEVNLAS